MRECTSEKEPQAEDKRDDKYPGVAVDVADSEKVTPELVKDNTEELNNNPRNND
ncbi:MAG: hypothetical protein OSJ37_06160 [Muribaculaceae bacterium]|jgi:hypothetical protein|nr:hypothetical protein [Muribaculaceae bacterium]